MVHTSIYICIFRNVVPLPNNIGKWSEVPNLSKGCGTGALTLHKVTVNLKGYCAVPEILMSNSGVSFIPILFNFKVTEVLQLCQRKKTCTKSWQTTI